MIDNFEIKVNNDDNIFIFELESFYWIGYFCFKYEKSFIRL